jgi:hypothetical protein
MFRFVRGGAPAKKDLFLATNLTMHLSKQLGALTDEKIFTKRPQGAGYDAVTAARLHIITIR